MLEITYVQMLIFISIIWVILRGVVAVNCGQISVKRELQMLLIYVCIVVICRFVYFEFHLVDGKIPTLKVGFADDPSNMINLIPFTFLADRYDGWRMNIIGNVAMFIPVGIVLPICFKKLNSISKTIIVGAGFTLFIELTQLLCYERHTDIDDLILNTLGVAIGACIVFAIRSSRKDNLL